MHVARIENRIKFSVRYSIGAGCLSYLRRCLFVESGKALLQALELTLQHLLAVLRLQLLLLCVRLLHLCLFLRCLAL